MKVEFIKKHPMGYNVGFEYHCSGKTGRTLIFQGYAKDVTPVSKIKDKL